MMMAFKQLVQEAGGRGATQQQVDKRRPSMMIHKHLSYEDFLIAFMMAFPTILGHLVLSEYKVLHRVP